jgi:hypothetical protein
MSPQEIMLFYYIKEDFEVIELDLILTMEYGLTIENKLEEDLRPQGEMIIILLLRPHMLMVSGIIQF